MSDHQNPSVFTQPDGDADDVLGHAAPDFRAAMDTAPGQQPAEDDVEGHRVMATDRVMAADDSGEDDVEGHRYVAADRVAAVNDTGEDDVEGHRASF